MERAGITGICENLISCCDYEMAICEAEFPLMYLALLICRNKVCSVKMEREMGHAELNFLFLVRMRRLSTK
jgi:hypothetical protein